MKHFYRVPSFSLMKALHQFAAFALFIGFVAFSSGMAKHHPSSKATTLVANVDLTLQNKCTRDVKYETVANGATQNGLVPKGDKVRVSIAVGTAITVDGEDFMTVSATDNGQTFQVCR
jgi:hypothetical protein